MDAENQGTNREVGYGKPPVETRFKPGQSGNPGGRPKGVSLTALLREAMEQPDGETTVAQELVNMAIREAKAGNFQFFKEVLDRVDGKVIDKVEIDDARKAYDVGNSPEIL